MPSSGYTRFIPYALVVAVLVLVGFNSLKGEGGDSASGASFGAAGSGAASGPSSDGSAASGAGGSGGDSGGLSISSSTEALVVDVAGGVVRPGVYRLPAGSRVIDAIRKAGGVGAHGLPGSINRAAKLADGQQVVVPVALAAAGPGGSFGGAAGGGGSGGTAGAASAGGAGGAAGVAAAGSSAGAGTAAPISLGSATAEQLEQIDGIGPVTAADIIEFRDSKGGLSSVDQLDQVSGIGPVTMEALRSGLQP